MDGSRLFITGPDQALVARWVDLLRARMRARRLFDVVPGAQVVTHPWGDLPDAMTHLDRLYARDNLRRGALVKNYDYAPELHPLERRKRELDALLDEWLARQKRAELLDAMVGGWGDVYPKILLVGDRYNGDRDAALPFSNKNGASKILSTLLDHARLSEQDLYFINAFRPDGSPWLTPGRLALLAPYEIVTLGREAFQRVDELATSFVTFPHPQYLGQFQGPLLAKWGAKLRALVEHVL